MYAGDSQGQLVRVPVLYNGSPLSSALRRCIEGNNKFDAHLAIANLTSSINATITSTTHCHEYTHESSSIVVWTMDG